MDISVFEEVTTMEGVQQLPGIIGSDFITGPRSNLYSDTSMAWGIVISLFIVPIILTICVTHITLSETIISGKKLSIPRRILSGVIALITIVLGVFAIGYFPVKPATHVNGELFHSSRIYVSDEDRTQDIEDIRGSWVHVNHDLVQEKLRREDSNLAHYNIQCTDMPEEKERASVLCGGDTVKEVTAYKDDSRYTLDPQFEWYRSEGKPVITLNVNVEAH